MNARFSDQFGFYFSHLSLPPGRGLKIILAHTAQDHHLTYHTPNLGAHGMQGFAAAGMGLSEHVIPISPF